jgi:protein-L-isoaspartate O-methyltransferase
MVVPVGPQGGAQHLKQYDKGKDGTVTMTRICGVRYVPLTARDDPYYS